MNYIKKNYGKSLFAASAISLMAGSAWADQVILDDLIVDGSICAGQDCVNGESFGFDTLRLKENNLRIAAVDTSSTSSFPTNDWQITFNDSSNGGKNKFSIDDIDGGRTPFTIEASAPSNSIYLEDGGRVGFGTATPVVQLHVVDGNTPTLRLEQDGSSGFTAQTWDVASNEANFFIRDATNGSQLPFRIQPGADSNTLYLADDNNVGLGTTNPSEALHIRRSGTDVDANVLAEASGGGDAILKLKTDGAEWGINNAGDSGRFKIGVVGGTSPFKIDELANTNLMKLGDNANPDAVFIEGRILVNATQLTVPDYVFETGYDLMPLTDVRAFINTNGHLPKVPSAKSINTSNGLSIVDMQMTLLEKVEELTLYTLAQEDVIATLEAKVDALENASN